MNAYAGLDDLKRALNRTSTDSDAALLALLEDVSAGVDQELGRRFWSKTETRYFEGEADSRLDIPDLVSITSVAVDGDGDGTWETTLASTEYFAEPANRDNEPITRLVLNSLGNSIGWWPTYPRGVRIIGLWGYSDETESAGTLGAAMTDTTGTSVTMSSGHRVQAGNTIRIGTEDLYVTAVSTNTLTVERGVNGTTAATHLISAAVSRRRFPRPIERAVLLQCSRLWQAQQTGFGDAVGGNAYGGFSVGSTFPIIQDLEKRFSRRRAFR